MSITTVLTLFEQRYGLGETAIGLTFIANDVGSMVGTLISGKLLDIDYRRVQAQYRCRSSHIGHLKPDNNNEFSRALPGPHDGFPLEQARLRLVPLLALSTVHGHRPLRLDHSVPSQVHIAVLIVSTFIAGWTAVSTQSVIKTYLVDVFPDRSAAASAGLTLARCLFAAGGTNVVMPMVNGIGVGWAFTVCVAVQIVALLGLAVQWRWGGQWRMEAARAGGVDKSN